MEMDRQTIMVLCCAVIGLTLFGGMYLSGTPMKAANLERPLYAKEDIRYKFQQEDAKKPKPKKVEPAVEPTAEPSVVTNTTGLSSSKRKGLSSSKPRSSSSEDSSSEDESSDESSSGDEEAQEEPELD